MFSNEQFDRTRRLALRLAGIELSERHRELLCRRSQRLAMPGSRELDALLDAVEAGEASAVRQFVSLVTTKFTGFFRHPGHFEAAARHALEAVQRRGTARLWSAGAATGEEPYSLAMALIEAFRSDDPAVTILATDIDEPSLAIARRGEYRGSALKALEPGRRDRFLSEPAGAGHWRIAPSVRRLVEFQTLNLVDTRWPVEGGFDVIFCRNVLMYLETCHRYAALERLASRLAPDSLLILDPAEHPGKGAHFFTPGVNGVYRRQRASCPPSRGVMNWLQLGTNASARP